MSCISKVDAIEVDVAVVGDTTNRRASREETV